MSNQKAWEVYSLFSSYSEADAFGMGAEWRDAEDQIHVHDFEAIA